MNSGITFALYFGNRGFFPSESIAHARAEMIKAVTDAGCGYICLEPWKPLRRAGSPPNSWSGTEAKTRG